MPISYPDILNYRTEGVRRSWTDVEPMLYALGIGMADDPLDDKELRFVSGSIPKVVPTFATIIARQGDPGPLPINKALVLDGGRDLTVHRPLAAEADVILAGRIVQVHDKGVGKGAIIQREVIIKDACTGDPLATLVTTAFARGDGGFGGPDGTPGGGETPPTCAPDRIIEIPTRPDQALLYSLSGDRNPLHTDPAIARKAGFERPILHGLCTYGICCRALLQTYADHDPAAIRRFAARFSAPTFPGETVVVALWVRGRKIAFEARIKERGVTVIKHGMATLA